MRVFPLRGQAFPSVIAGVLDLARMASLLLAPRRSDEEGEARHLSFSAEETRREELLETRSCLGVWGVGDGPSTAYVV